MKRFLSYLLFIASLLSLMFVLVWFGKNVIQSHEEKTNELERVREIEQSRLALWRLDSLIASMLVTENDRLITDYMSGAKKTAPWQETSWEPFVNAYFQIDAMGEYSLPRSGVSSILNLSQLQNYTSDLKTTLVSNAKKSHNSDIGHIVDLNQELATKKEVEEVSVSKESVADNHAAGKQSNVDFVERKKNVVASNSFQYTQVVSEQVEMPAAAKRASQSHVLGQTKKNARVSGALQKSAHIDNDGAEDLFQNESVQTLLDSNINDDNASAAPIYEPTEIVQQQLLASSLIPYFSNDQLFLVRTVQDGEKTFVQGMWINAQKISAYLQNSISDILPKAQLLLKNNGSENYMMMASLPFILNSNYQPVKPDNSEVVQSVYFGVGVAFICLLVIVFFLWGISKLSRKRAVFVSAVTHELRTPLTTFHMYTDMMDAGLVPDAKKGDYMRTMKKEASRLCHLVDNVLNYARVEKKVKMPQMEALDVRDLMGRVIDRIQPRLSEVNADSLVSFASDIHAIKVRADETAVEQIFYNLADNAVKYGSLDNDTLEFSVYLSGSYVCIDVSDHGQGIPQAMKKKIFTPFSRSAEEAAGKQPGVGLGLALCYELAKAMGGRLTLCRSSKEGTCFTLALHLSS